MKITEEFLLENGFVKQEANNGSYYSKNTYCVFYTGLLWAPCRIENNDIVVVGDQPYHFFNKLHLIQEYELSLKLPFCNVPPRQ